MTNTIYIVYKTSNIINNKIYIGVHQTKNINDGYLGSGDALKHAIRKYGKHNFIRTVLYDFKNEVDMYGKEKELVNEEFIKRKDVYNIAKGGAGGKRNIGNMYKRKPTSQETKQKLRELNLGKKLSQETKDKIGLKSTGRLHTQEAKKKISDAKKGHVNSKQCIKMLIERSTGKNGYKFSGYYLTPWGQFESSRSASTNLVSNNGIKKWCKSSDNIINNRMLSKSPYLQSLKKSPIGKTFRDIGFHFERL